eukprot:2989953-Prymnesium_polylepis.1
MALASLTHSPVDTTSPPGPRKITFGCPARPHATPLRSARLRHAVPRAQVRAAQLSAACSWRAQSPDDRSETSTRLY